MNYIKLGLWIVIPALLYAGGLFNIGGIYPEFLFIVAVIYSIISRTFRERVTVSLICGIIMGALGGRGFLFSLLLVVYSSLIFGLIFRGRMKQKFIFVPVMVFIITVLYELLFGTVINGFNNETIIISSYGGIVNALSAVIIYPLMKLTFEEKERYIF